MSAIGWLERFESGCAVQNDGTCGLKSDPRECPFQEGEIWSYGVTLVEEMIGLGGVSEQIECSKRESDFASRLVLELYLVAPSGDQGCGLTSEQNSTPTKKTTTELFHHRNTSTGQDEQT